MARPCHPPGQAPSQRQLAFAILGLALAVGGCSRHPETGPSGAQLAPARGRGLPVPVTVATAVNRDVPLELAAIGSARAFASVALKTRVDGQLARAAVEPGQEVKSGDLLFQIDPRPFETALKQAEALLERDLAALTNAQTDMHRTDQLGDSKAVSATVVDANRARVATLQASVAADRAAVRTASLQLSFCSVVSPVTGRMGMLLVDVGNMVKNNETVLAVVNQTKPIYVDFAVPEASVMEVRSAAAAGPLRVQAVFPQHPEAAAVGELRAVNNQVEAATGTLLLRAVFPNEDERFWPGQFLNVVLTVGRLPNAILVPAQAVQSSQAGDFVFVVNAGATVEKRLVTLGPVRGGDAVVQAGVRVGETVVTDGQMRLVPGAKVDIRTPGRSPMGKDRAEKGA